MGRTLLTDRSLRLAILLAMLVIILAGVKAAADGGVSRYGTESAGNAARTLAYTARARCDFTGGAGCGGVDVVHRHIGRIAERICPFAPPVPRHDDGKTE